MDQADEDPNSALFASDKWHETSVKIKLPADKEKFTSEEDAPEFEVEGLHYRKPLEVLKSAYEEVSSRSFHTTPYKLFWQPDEHEFPERIISEVYTADAMLQEHQRIKAQPQEPGCNLETVVAAIMLWSDSTHLASFGHAALWPIYMFIGNQSKYLRNKPLEFAAHHLAYIPKLPDLVHEYYMRTYGKAVTSAVLTHLKRDLMHAIWLLLLDDEFMHAYEHGIVIRFADNVCRRVFPRFFTYAADYPEKVLLACIKFLGKFPCPRCLIPKGKIEKLGSTLDRLRRTRDARVDNHARRSMIDRVRDWIFTKGRNVASSVIDKVLGPMSLVPIRNAFSERLSPLGFDFYSLFVPDFMHEFELGVWKGTLTHLLRIMYAFGGDTIQQFDARWDNNLLELDCLRD
ncbi:hypothetical protein M405DRAFT_786759 [Rhizopogon salebrosus TDB-379]|nr:hypothetical protein M405DRAFT_786759 [Rhizopogon salebrosus TDB-379]